MILLGCGLSLARDSSFARQLRLLAAGLRARGRRCLLLGTGAALRLGEDEADVPRIDAAAVRALSRETPEAAILLGYPDQLPILAEPGPPLFLWAQFSRPPAARCLARATAVPLTERTRGFLAQARCASLGPTIPHGVDTTLFRPAAAQQRPRFRVELGIGDDTLVVGTVGANTTRKRFDLLIEAFARLRPSSCLLLIKTDRARAPGGFDLEALARRRGAEARVRVITDALPAAALARLYAAMDVYAHAAEWEGFCVPVAEAMACGLPVAAADTQGPGEIVPYREGLVSDGEWIEEEGGSRLFHVNPTALAAAIGRLAGDPALRARLGSLGRAEALRSCDAGVVAARWLACIAGAGVQSQP